MYSNQKFQTFLYLTFAIFILACATGNAKSKETRPPNILFIIIDDMGWKDLSCTGSKYYETPNIDKLAAEGLRFTNAYSAAPVCTPSRGAIFSGKCPARTKLTTVFDGPSGPDSRLYDRSKYQGENDQFFEARQRHALPETEVIIPYYLSESGYKTGFFGKWHIGECPGYYPDERGFDVAKGYRLKQPSGTFHWMKDFKSNGANMEGEDPDAYLSDVITKECTEFITENKDKTWMAVLSHYLVHAPIEPKPEKLEKYKKKPTTDQDTPGYASMVESVDESVGIVMKTLNELGLDENTLVIFTSDNGGLTPKSTSNYPLMGGKSFPFEAGMKVPFIVKWPGKIKKGTSEQRIIGTDIYPTMLSIAGVPLRPEQHMDGVNLLPLFTKQKTLKKRPLIFHYPHYTHATGPFSSIIENNWKLIRFYNDEEGAYLLYNLAKDPQEQNNLAKVNNKMLKKLVRSLDKSLLSMDAEMPIKNPEYDPNYKGKKYNLKHTLGLAERERVLFEKRLHKK